jgi:ATP adenylyltransferase
MTLQTATLSSAHQFRKAWLVGFLFSPDILCYNLPMPDSPINYEDFLKQPRPCPFCNARKDEIIAENEQAFITFALAPYHQDHMLVVPKRHVEKILDVTEKEEDAIYALVRKATKMLHKLGYTDISVLVRDGDDSMKTVNHLHYNIIPDTRLGDIDHQGKKRTVMSAEQTHAEFERLKGAV